MDGLKLRAEGEGGYEAYEVKNKRQKMRCLLLHREKKNIIYLFMKSLHGKKFLNGPTFSSCEREEVCQCV